MTHVVRNASWQVCNKTSTRIQRKAYTQTIHAREIFLKHFEYSHPVVFNSYCQMQDRYSKWRKLMMGPLKLSHRNTHICAITINRIYKLKEIFLQISHWAYFVLSLLNYECLCVNGKFKWYLKYLKTHKISKAKLWYRIYLFQFYFYMHACSQKINLHKYSQSKFKSSWYYDYKYSLIKNSEFQWIFRIFNSIQFIHFNKK